eukprot:TRINITY_DN10931_c0_g1_i1.p1 TRINITY_DN10931_c0_g1~~TRINITY_DN10931_c0_g1_i1.p1  ORF type:complete len:1922 (+),score=489.68 TRINITY_DN10931_c0_g1_i1:113-5767(+)
MKRRRGHRSAACLLLRLLIAGTLCLPGSRGTPLPSLPPLASPPTGAPTARPTAAPSTVHPTGAPWDAGALSTTAGPVWREASEAAEAAVRSDEAADAAAEARETLHEAARRITALVNSGQVVEASTAAHHIRAERFRVADIAVTGVLLPSEGANPAATVTIPAGAIAKNLSASSQESLAAAVVTWRPLTESGTASQAFPDATWGQLRGSPTATSTALPDSPEDAAPYGETVVHVQRAFVTGHVVDTRLAVSPQGRGEEPVLRLLRPMVVSIDSAATAGRLQQWCDTESASVAAAITQANERVDPGACTARLGIRAYVPRYGVDIRQVVLPRAADGSLGLQLGDDTSDSGEVAARITRVLSPEAAAAGLRSGDRITAVGSSAVAGAGELLAEAGLLAGSVVPITVDEPVWQWQELSNATVTSAGRVSGMTHLVVPVAAFGSVQVTKIVTRDPPLSSLSRLVRDLGIALPLGLFYLLYLVLLFYSYYLDSVQDTSPDAGEADIAPAALCSPYMVVTLEAGGAPLQELAHDFAEAAGVAARRVEVATYSADGTTLTVRVLPPPTVSRLVEKHKRERDIIVRRGSSSGDLSGLREHEERFAAQLRLATTGLTALAAARQAVGVLSTRGAVLDDIPVVSIVPAGPLDDPPSRGRGLRTAAYIARTAGALSALRTGVVQIWRDLRYHQWVCYWYRGKGALLTRCRRLNVAATNTLTVCFAAVLFMQDTHRTGSVGGMATTAAYVALAAAPVGAALSAVFKRVHKPATELQHRAAIVAEDAPLDDAAFRSLQASVPMRRRASRRYSTGSGFTFANFQGRRCSGIAAAVTGGADLELSPRGGSYVGVFAGAPPAVRYQPDEEDGSELGSIANGDGAAFGRRAVSFTRGGSGLERLARAYSLASQQHSEHGARRGPAVQLAAPAHSEDLPSPLGVLQIELKDPHLDRKLAALAQSANRPALFGRTRSDKRVRPQSGVGGKFLTPGVGGPRSLGGSLRSEPRRASQDSQNSAPSQPPSEEPLHHSRPRTSFSFGAAARRPSAVSTTSTPTAVRELTDGAGQFAQTVPNDHGLQIQMQSGPLARRRPSPQADGREGGLPDAAPQRAPLHELAPRKIAPGDMDSESNSPTRAPEKPLAGSPTSPGSSRDSAATRPAPDPPLSPGLPRDSAGTAGENYWLGAWYDWGKGAGEEGSHTSDDALHSEALGPQMDVSVVRRPGEAQLGMRWRDHTRLAEVVPGGPASRCGLQMLVGMRVTHVDGAPVQRLRQLRRRVAASRQPAITFRFLDEKALPCAFADRRANGRRTVSSPDSAGAPRAAHRESPQDSGAAVSWAEPPPGEGLSLGDTMHRSQIRGATQAAIAAALGEGSRRQRGRGRAKAAAFDSVQRLTALERWRQWRKWVQVVRRGNLQPVRLVDGACGWAYDAQLHGLLPVGEVVRAFLRRVAPTRPRDSVAAAAERGGPRDPFVLHSVLAAGGEPAYPAVPLSMTVGEVADHGQRTGGRYMLRVFAPGTPPGEAEHAAKVGAEHDTHAGPADPEVFAACVSPSGASAHLRPEPRPPRPTRVLLRLAARWPLLLGTAAAAGGLYFAYGRRLPVPSAAALLLVAALSGAVEQTPRLALAVCWLLVLAALGCVVARANFLLGLFFVAVWGFTPVPALAFYSRSPLLLSLACFALWVFAVVYIPVVVLELPAALCIVLATAVALSYPPFHMLADHIGRPYTAAVLFSLLVFILWVVLVGVVPWGRTEPSFWEAAWMGGAISSAGVGATLLAGLCDGVVGIPGRLPGQRWVVAAHLGALAWHAATLAGAFVLGMALDSSDLVWRYWAVVGWAVAWQVLVLEPARIAVLSQRRAAMWAFRRTVCGKVAGRLLVDSGLPAAVRSLRRPPPSETAPAHCES